MIPVNCGCGGKAEVHIVGHELPKAQYYINCEKCDVRTWFYDTEAEAIEAWNMAMGERTAKVKRSTSMLELHQWDGICENYGGHVYQDYAYCQHCGYRLEWE